MAVALGDGAGAGDDYRVFRNDEGQLVRGAQNGSVYKIEDRSAAGEDGSGGQHGALAHDGSFVDAAIATHQHVVLNDHRAGVHRLQHAADLSRGAQMNPLADLRAGADQRMRVHHSALVDKSSGVDVHRRHADHAASHIGPCADRRASGHYANPITYGKMAYRVSVLVHK